MNTIENQNSLQVANIIAQQIGARAFFMMGTRCKVGSEHALQFDIRGCSEFNKVCVTLDMGSDTYVLKFMKVNRMGHVLRSKEIADVYAEDLNRIISDYTGLALSL